MQIKITGVYELQTALKKNATMALVKKVVSDNGKELEKKIVNNAVFTRGYSTGQTKGSIRGEITDGGLTVRAGACTEYAPYVEHGTRKMSAQPFVKPSFEQQSVKFKSDMDKLVR